MTTKERIKQKGEIKLLFKDIIILHSGYLIGFIIYFSISKKTPCFSSTFPFVLLFEFFLIHNYIKKDRNIKVLWRLTNINLLLCGLVGGLFLSFLLGSTTKISAVLFMLIFIISFIKIIITHLNLRNRIRSNAIKNIITPYSIIQLYILISFSIKIWFICLCI